LSERHRLIPPPARQLKVSGNEHAGCLVAVSAELEEQGPTWSQAEVAKPIEYRQVNVVPSLEIPR